MHVCAQPFNNAKASKHNHTFKILITYQLSESLEADEQINSLQLTEKNNPHGHWSFSPLGMQVGLKQGQRVSIHSGFSLYPLQKRNQIVAQISQK